MPATASPAVVSIRHWLVHIPFTAPIVWGSGTRWGPTRLVVEVATEGGICGYGATICLLDSIEPVLTQVVMPLAIGKGVDQAEHLVRHVLGAGYYHHKRAAVMALCAVEMAMWDALGRAPRLPLHRLWGGAYRSEMSFAAYLFINDTGRVAEAARSFADRGYELQAQDRRRRAVRHRAHPRGMQAVGDAVPLRVDVNGAWTPGTARRRCARSWRNSTSRTSSSRSSSTTSPGTPTCGATSRSRSPWTRARTRLPTSATSCAWAPPT